MQITFQGNPLTLVGAQLKVGDTAPDFTALNQELKPVKLSELKGRTVVISSVPSLDTPVCEFQTKRFNQEAGKLDAVILTISMDLPFAQKRFCDTFKTSSILLVSDYRDHSFGNAYGLVIKELGLLARAVIVVDKTGKIAYQEIVPEVTKEPNYAEVLKKLS